jgi:hypothetical protein
MSDHDYRHAPYDPAKYVVAKADGSPAEPGAAYFVLRLDTDRSAREAAEHYARLVYAVNPALALGIADRLRDTFEAATVEAMRLEGRTLERLEALVVDLGGREPLHGRPARASLFLGRHAGPRGEVRDLYLAGPALDTLFTVGPGGITQVEGVERFSALSCPHPALAAAFHRAVVAGLVAAPGPAP